MTHGKLPYKDFWWVYGPLMPYYYGLFYKIFGMHITSVLLGRAVLADVLAALYPGQGRDAALTSFRQFRREVSLAAEKAGVRMSIETDGQTRRAPGERARRAAAGRYGGRRR